MKRNVVRAMLGVAMLASLTGCGNTVEEQPIQNPEIHESVTEVTEVKEEVTDNIKEDTEVKDMTHLEKTAMMADKLSKDGANMLYSPMSLDMALGLVAEGSAGSTREQLNKYLLSEDYSSKAKEYIGYLDSINTDTSKLNIANSIWLNKTCEINKDYFNKVSESFRATVDKLDFDNDVEGSANTINDWVSDKTNSLIKEAVSPSNIQAGTQSILVNSLYFNSPWVEMWETSEGKTLNFTNEDNTLVEIDALYGKVDCYFENDKATAFGKNYDNGMMFIGILPKEEGTFTISELDLDSLIKSAEYSKYNVYAEMMRMTYEYTTPALSDALKEIGVVDMFGADADIKGILESGDSLYVDDVIQKCKIILDEEKTEAAATTVVIMTNGIAPMEKEYREVILDRPFAYIIYDTVNSEVIFIGKYVNAN